MTKLAVTIPEAVEMTGIGRSSIYRLIRERKITPRKMGSRTIILVDELKSLVENLPTAAWEDEHMLPQNNVAGLAGRGDITEKSKVTALSTYSTAQKTSTEIASLVLAARYRLTPPVARLVCHLAGIGDAQ